MAKAREPIYFCTQWMTGEEKAAVRAVMESDWVTTLGPDQGEFEREFCARLSPKVRGVALSSGTSALELGFRLLSVEPGDTVISSTFSFIATISPAVRMGAVPIFVDSEEDSWNMDPALLEDAMVRLKKRGKRAKAVVLAHAYGQSADVGEIVKICDRFEVPLLEDAAEAVGTYFKRRHVGTFGKLAVFSFNGNKTVTTGGGGMLCSLDPALIKQASYLAFQAKELGSWEYVHRTLGYNFRLSNVLCAIGRAQVRRLPEILKRKDEIHARYSEWAVRRDDVALLEAPRRFPNRASHWLNILRLRSKKAKLERIQLKDFLGALGIQTRPVWYPLHRQPVFHGCQVFSRGIADSFHAESICLPSGISLNDKQVTRVIEGLDEALGPLNGAKLRRRKGSR